MNQKYFLLLLASLCFYTVASAQTYSVQGRAIDGTAGIEGVTFILTQTAEETTASLGAVTDTAGVFVIQNVPPGNYVLKGNFLGFLPLVKNISVTSGDLQLGDIAMVANTKSLNTVLVKGTLARSEQNGDTTAFNADAFKTNPDATAEDLLNKMPGVSTSGGTLKVNGEEVKKVLVDGKPFFGDDPNAAIKNLPSEIVDKIQVFDRASDQSQFTGFDDGNSEKTINIQTKRGRNNGVFGKITAGGGTDDAASATRYNTGGNINFFNGDRRISLVGMANNINQQNFSADDLLGVSSSSGNSGGGRRGNFSGGGGGGRGPMGGGGSAGNFLVSQQGGITQTQSAGINYSDAWSKKLKVSGSYFFNRAENTTQTDVSRDYILRNDDSSLVYKESGLAHSVNMNHRVSARAEWTIDSNNSLFIIPRLSYQMNETDKTINGANTVNDVIRGSSLQNTNRANINGMNLSNSIFYNHKFKKRGRTISVNSDTRYNTRKGDGSLYSVNDYVDSVTLTDQRYDLDNIGTTFGGSINYTEPVGKHAQIQVNYNPSITHNESEKLTYDKDGAGNYADQNLPLSNSFKNDYITHKAGLGWRYNDEKIMFNATVNGQSATLTGDQTYPTQLSVDKTFQSILPQAMMNIKFSKTENLRVFYRTNTNAPSITQLQNVVDNTNPLQLRTGNPDLKQDYTHNIFLRYGRTKAGKGSGFFLFANGTITNNYIGNSTIVRRDGVQISMPVNLNSMYRANAFANYSLPLTSLKSNFNINGGLSYTQTPSLVNSILNKTQNYGLNAGFVLGSNISEKIDFTLSTNGSYNIARGTAQAGSNYNYYNQTSSLRFNWIFGKGFVFNTDVNHTLYTGLGAGFNQNFFLWNASFGKKFLKNRSLQADVYAFDILKQNNSISRTINDYYVEDTRTTVLQRFFMLRLTYTIRYFKGTARMPEGDKPPEGMPPMHPHGDRPPGPGGPMF